jgi:quinol monooxygenase YgiN
VTVVVIGSMRFSPANVAAVLPHLRALVAATREQDGCIAYDAGEDIFDPGLIRFSEIWPDADTLARHLTAPHIAPWREVARSLGVSERSFTAFDASGARAV